MAHRILIAGFKHETNTFSSQPADLAAYEARGLHRGDALLWAYAGTRTEIAAYLDAAERYGWDIVIPISGNATPSGPVTTECFETIVGEVIEAVARDGPFDAVLLALHGAMVTEEHEDGEGEMLRRVRAVVGAGVPIGVSLDLHANVTDVMAEHADILISYRTYPHVDSYETAQRVALRVAGMLDGTSGPTTTVARGEMLDGLDHGRTTSPGPMLDILALCDDIAAREEGILDISLNAGFPWADIHDAGPTVMVVGEGRDPRYRRIADRIVSEIWNRRRDVTVDPLTPRQAMDRIAELGPGSAPVVVADFADNPGGGGYGDATGLLGAMLEARLERAAMTMMQDPVSVQACFEAGTGAEVALELGGRTDPAYGAPISVNARVEQLCEGQFRLEGPMAKGVMSTAGPSARISVGGVQVCLSTLRGQALDRQHFRHFGIEPDTMAVLAVKSAQHFRAAFAPIAREVLVVDDGRGLTSRNYRALTYRRLRRPVYPLDHE
ncbi:MAG: M81 family metallopeptidase [Alphaproteobacteria bacterium]|nr:M81 family metallopeptidase [Alphaproteobacteria bacterium]